MKKYKDITILYEDNHLLVVIKPEGILSQADDTKDLDMLTILKEYLKVTYQKEGNVYLGLVHRLDRRVSGVMVFAKTSKAASRLSNDVRNHNFKKIYYAVCCGLINGYGTLTNKLEKTDNVSVESDEGKESTLDYQALDNFKLDNKNFSLVEVKLHTGRFNQIRKQFSLINKPLINDFKYGYTGNNYNDHIGLFCVKLSFPHPITKEELTFSYDEIINKTKEDWMNYFK